jgi:hypothetical protein
MKLISDDTSLLLPRQIDIITPLGRRIQMSYNRSESLSRISREFSVTSVKCNGYRPGSLFLRFTSERLFAGWFDVQGSFYWTDRQTGGDLRCWGTALKIKPGNVANTTIFTQTQDRGFCFWYQQQLAIRGDDFCKKGFSGHILIFRFVQAKVLTSSLGHLCPKFRFKQGGDTPVLRC